MRRMIGFMAAAAFMAGTATCLSQETSAVSVAGERLPIVKKCAADYPKFHKEWMSAIAQADPEAFIRLLQEPALLIQDEERLTARSLTEIYVQSGMSPWLAFVEDGYPGTAVVPSGKLHIMVRANFSTFMKDRERKAAIAELAVKPPLPRLAGESSTGWMPSRTTEGNPVIHGWVDQSLWLKIPDDAPVGPVPLEIYLLAEGSQNGSVVKETQKEQYRIRVVPAGTPTRENVLCLWAFAVDSGKWLAKPEERTAEARKARQSHLAWVENLFNEFEKVEGLGELVDTLRTRDEYVQNVLSRLEKESDKPEGDQGK